MIVTSGPSTYNFAGNITSLVIATDQAVEFALHEADKELLRENYMPLGGVVSIDLRHLMQNRCTPTPLTTDHLQFSPLTPYRYTVNDTPGDLFYVLHGGVGSDLVDQALFLRTSWLSWQPQTRHTTYHMPQWLRYVALVSSRVRLRAYIGPGHEPAERDIATLEAGHVYTFDLSYAFIAGTLDSAPAYYDVWVEDPLGNTLSYIQRYVYKERDDFNADTFIWANSLGGYDSASFHGERVESLEIETRTAFTCERNLEYELDFTRSYKKSTGWINDEATRLWILDFFHSTERYHLGDHGLERIYVTKPKLEATRGAIAGYDFIFSPARAQRYLNLERGPMPENLTITAPSGELFFLAPRLSEFPLATGDDWIFAVQSPALATWHQLSLGALRSLLALSVGGSGGVSYLSRLLDVNIRQPKIHDLLVYDGVQWINTPHSPHASSHALQGRDPLSPSMIGAADRHHNHGDIYHPLEGSAEIPLSASEIISDEFRTPDFATGYLGRGARIDAAGDGELRSLALREFLEVPELRYNRITVIGAEQWVTEGATVAEILPDSRPQDNLYILQLKLEKGDPNPFLEGDLLRGIYHNMSKEKALNIPNPNEGMGGRSTSSSPSGFHTINLRVSFVSPDGTMAVVPDDPARPPQRFLTLARIGNNAIETTAGGVITWRYPERQRSIYLSSKDGCIRVLRDVTSFSLERHNTGIALGRCDEFLPPEYPDLHGQFNAYLENVLLGGAIFTVTPSGTPVPIVRYVGRWQKDTEYTKYQEVTHTGCKWVCDVAATRTEPRYDNPHWILSEGFDDLSLALVSTEGTRLAPENLRTTIIATVKRGYLDITATLSNDQFNWSRISRDAQSDAMWNAAHRALGPRLPLSLAEDLPAIRRDGRVTFTCQAIVYTDLAENIITQSFEV